MNSKLLYFKETTPNKEQIFNSYMGDAVMWWNEEFKAEAVASWDMQGMCGAQPVFFALYLQQKWQEMVRDN